MKHRFPFVILGLMVIAGSILPAQSHPALLNSAFTKTQSENFEQAIQDLQKATNFFVGQKDWENVYKSQSLITVLRNSLKQKNALEAKERFHLPEWYKLGTCLGENDICEYSLIGAPPDTTGTDF